MNSIDMIVNFFKQGGPFLYPIAAVFAVGLGFAAERFIYLTRVAKRQSPPVGGTRAAHPGGQLPQGHEVAEQQDSALSTIMRYGMSRISTAQRARTSRRRWRRVSSR